jgi:hypothetical protein
MSLKECYLCLEEGTTEMTKKYKYRLGTMDGHIEWEEDAPELPPMTPEQIAEELDRMYPRSKEKASYLQYPCSFCTEKFFLISPYRSRGMNPYSEGFMVRYKNSKKNKVTPTCRKCLLDLCNRNESVWISGYKDG